MSRWDALKPVQERNHPKRCGKPFSNKNSSSSTTRRRNGGVDDDNDHAASSRVLQYHQLRQQLREKDHRVDAVVIVSLSECISSAMKDLLAEKVVSETVFELLLPHLLIKTSADADADALIPLSTASSQQVVLATLQKLLNDTRYGSAMLAPLVDHVSETGEERQRANAIRRRLFETLQTKLLEISKDDDNASAGSAKSMLLEATVCHTLATALKAAYQMDRTKRHANGKTDIDVSAVKTYTHRVFESCSSSDVSGNAAAQLTSSALELLLAFLRRHPEAAAAFTLSLLENNQLQRPPAAARTVSSLGGGGLESSRKNEKMECPRCGFSGKSTFLNLLHSSQTTMNASRQQQQQQLAMECTLELLNHSPLDLWLMQQGQRTTGVEALRSTLSYPDRIIAGLDTVVRITQCLVGNRTELSDAVTLLAKTLLLKIPYHQSEILQKSASHLLSALAKIIILAKEVKPENCRAIDVLVEAAGGHMTPQGQLSSMSSALRTWLGSKEGKAFLGEILTGTTFMDQRSSNQATVQKARLCRSFVRLYPKLVTENQDLWQAFQNRFEQLTTTCNDPAGRLAGLEMLVGLLQGRRDQLADDNDAKCMADESCFRISSVWPVLLRMVLEGNASCKRVACDGYAFLLPWDWDDLFSAEESEEECEGGGGGGGGGGGCLLHIGPILELCLHANAGSMRTESCKSLGEVCTHYFSSKRRRSSNASAQKQMVIVCKRVCSLVVQACQDANYKVKSMALFVAGNLTMALKDVPATIRRDLIGPVSLGEIAHCVRRCMDDPDEKVVGNAIRSIGHVVVLMTMVSEEDMACDLAFFQDLLQFLSRKVQCTTFLLRPNEVSTSMTWKQRQAAKKHGWGACNTLARLLEAGLATKAELRQDVAVCLAALIECFENQEKELNEKVVCCASAALRVLDAATMSTILRLDYPESFLLARCTATCVAFVSEERGSDSRLCQEINLLLKHMLNGVSVDDAARVIQSEQASPSTLSDLCDWMIERDCSSRSFRAFALAMQHHDVVVDVDVEIRFSSRALENSPGDYACDDEL